jgi:hypothetical protein
MVKDPLPFDELIFQIDQPIRDYGRIIFVAITSI